MNDFSTDRDYEEKHLEGVKKTIYKNCEKLKAQIDDQADTIEKLSESYHDGDTEVWTILNNTIVLQEADKRSYEKNMRARKKPYFGRIIFTDEGSGKKESLYIGKGGIYNTPTTPMVADWRAPIANAYYENGLGKVNYTAPDDKEISIDLSLKRTFEIEDGKLLDYFDTDVVSNDELLTKYLGKNKEAVLGEIIATIQKEQNDIIRKTPYHNVIVQGAAGSGKTTVAMHRISYILYNYESRIKPDDFYIIGSNRMLLNYITGVLPDLDVTGVRQMTMEELFVRLLYEEWDDNKYKIKSMDAMSISSAVKGTSGWHAALLKYCAKLESDTIGATDIYLYPDQFVEGLKDDKPFIIDKREELGDKAREPILLMDALEITEYLENAKTLSARQKILMLNEKLAARLENELLGKGIKYTDKEQKAIRKYYKNYFNKYTIKDSVFDIYADFIKHMRTEGMRVQSPSSLLDVYDLAALSVIYKKLKEEEEISEAHHIIIDEAQDYGMMAYLSLDLCIKGCTYTVMGDISQNIRFGYGLNNWNELADLLLKNEGDSFCTLLKSYRNTVEISEFATQILDHGDFEVYPTKPIIRHGNKPQIIETADMPGESAKVIKNWQADGKNSIAVICRDEEEAEKTAELLSKYIELLDSNPETATFGKGVMVLPVSLTKGLEFDAVLIYNPTKKDYPNDNGHAKLLYVATTRALHELCIMCENKEDLTKLISAPVPSGKKRQELKESLSASHEEVIKERQEKKAAVKSQNESTRARILEEKTLSSEDRGTAKKQERPVIAKPLAKQTAASSLAKELEFGSVVPDDVLLIPGHNIISTAVKMVNKASDGLYLSSAAGYTRIRPVADNAVRVTFSKMPPVKDGPDMYKGFKYRDNGRQIDMVTNSLGLTVDRTTGAITFKDKSGREVVAERPREPRALLSGNAYLFLKNTINDSVHAVNMSTFESTYIKGSAKSITDPKADAGLILVKNKFGILIAGTKDAYFCDIVSLGAFFKADGNILDYYFIKGDTTDEISEFAKKMIL